MDTNKRSALGRLAALTGIVALAALTASMLSGLRHALGHRRREPQTERERVRQALAPILMEVDQEAWEREFGKLPEGFDRVAFRRSVTIDPPLSQAIIEEREEERGERG